MGKTMKKDIIGEYLKKASVLYLVGAILSIIIVLGGLVFYLVYIPQDIKEPEEKLETLAEKQLKELNRLRQNTEPLTEEQVQEQLDELGDLRGDTKPLTEEEVKEQLEELEKLRNK